MDIKFFNYAGEILADVILALFLGLSINKLVNIVASVFNLSFVAKIIIQVLLCIIVLYIMKSNSEYLYSTWQGPGTSIVFITLFITSQQNIVSVLMKIQDL